MGFLTELSWKMYPSLFIIAIGLAILIKGTSMAYRSFNSPMSDPTKMHRFVIGLRIAVIGITMAGPGGRVELGHSVAVRPVSGLRRRGDCGVNRPPPHAPKGAEARLRRSVLPSATRRCHPETAVEGSSRVQVALAISATRCFASTQNGHASSLATFRPHLH